MTLAHGHNVARSSANVSLTDLLSVANAAIVLHKSNTLFGAGIHRCYVPNSARTRDNCQVSESLPRLASGDTQRSRRNRKSRHVRTASAAISGVNYVYEIKNITSSSKVRYLEFFRIFLNNENIFLRNVMSSTAKTDTRSRRNWRQHHGHGPTSLSVFLRINRFFSV